MNYIKTWDQMKLYAKDWGRGHAVVMAHGWPLSADTFDELGMAIADAGMRAISYDRRGFGRSEQPWDGYDYDSLADDLAAVIDQCAATDVTLLGFSMGGGEVARYMSRHHGKHVRDIVLIAAVTPFMLKTADNPDGVDGRVFDQMRDGLTADRARFWADFFPGFYGAGLLSGPVSSDVLHWSSTIAMQASMKATLACIDAFSSTDFRQDLAAIRVPTLIIHGTSDKTVPIDVSARRAASMIAGSTLIEYDGAPHGLLASHKNRLAADVLDFIRR